MADKKVLLISNYIFHYRQKVYNYFYDRFKEDGYEFSVLSNEYQNAGFNLKFKAYCEPFSVKGYIKKIKEIKPDAVILFLHLKDKIELPIIYYCKAKGIPVIFWNKGLSDTDPNNKIKNMIYHHIHNLCDALITYTPDMISNFKNKNRKKLFVAYNTVDCSDINKDKYNPSEIRKKYGIKEDKVILYVSRMKESKKIDVLLDSFANVDGVAVVAMGAGMTDELQKKFDSAPNLYYLGQKYGEEGNEVWAIGTVFSIPVSCGLGINEAIYWNMPIVTMNGFQPPEIYYLKNGKNGIIAENEKEYKEKMLELLYDDDAINNMRKEAQKVYYEECGIDRMYQGFIDALRYADNK
ncbi:MAG: glycosyltransferase family 4 protein [Lachnospirales bacterium]